MTAKQAKKFFRGVSHQKVTSSDKEEGGEGQKFHNGGDMYVPSSGCHLLSTYVGIFLLILK